MVRPAKIERISLEWLSNPAQPLELPLEMVNEQRWQTVPVKAITSTLPTVVYDDGAYPLRNLSFWCVPTVVSNVIIYSWQPLNTFTDLVTNVTFPPGYFKALRYNLAVDLAPEFGRPVPPEVAAIAIQTKAIIENMNLPAFEMRVDPAVIDPKLRAYNWISDTPVSNK
jgi:hypothetical protein